jgi:D-glycero-D-manno-heptose 1,7-bisphosphate phosphatase
VGIDEVRRAVFLDRDGVLNHAIVRDGKPYPPPSLEELVIVEGAGEELQKLRDAGCLLIVITNQPDVARGTQTLAQLERIHGALRAALPIDEIISCTHDGDLCDCRKPKAGSLFDAARRYGVDLPRSFMVGDRWRDVEAGQRAAVTSIFIDLGYNERQPEQPFIRVTSLAAAVGCILERIQLEDR